MNTIRLYVALDLFISDNDPAEWWHEGAPDFIKSAIDECEPAKIWCIDLSTYKSVADLLLEEM